MKTTMKLLTALLLILSLSLTVCACDGGDSETTAEGVTTAAPTEEATEAPTEAPTEEETDAATEDNGLTTYKITVVDAEGTPVANIPVQLCQGEICRLPVPTGADGVALIEVEADDYTAKALYNGGETDSYEFDENNELTIVLE